MKKIDKFLDSVDESIEKKISPVWLVIQKYFVFFSTSLLVLLLMIFFLKIYQDTSGVRSAVISEDLDRLEQILNRIDKECNILSIRTQGADLNFFTVEKFAGSNVGCLNLAYPKNWRGPYLRQDPTIDGRFYEIVRANDGYFIVPGQGVKLPNDMIMGKDIVINNHTRVYDLLKPGGKLNFKGQALATQLKFKIGDWDYKKPKAMPIKTIDTFEGTGATIKEFSEALPYTQRGEGISESHSI
jgi:hypothetical protein